ncbi:MAG TPA: hypothetical protein PK902_04795, partial [Actinomycetota bacterium]|nr:hypothetical protein [Actinomycetota bacterium]
MITLKTATGAGVAAFAIGATTLFGGAAIANAAPKDQTKVSAQTHKHADRVTGEEAQKAIDAALAEVPGTADHAHKTADGGYLVKVKTTEGKTVVVTLNSAFEVTGTKEMTRKDKGGKHKGDRIAITAEEKASAEAAALAEVPGATVDHVHKTKDGGYIVEVRTSDGTKKIVKLDASFAVTGVDDAKAG